MCWFWNHEWKLMKKYHVEKKVEYPDTGGSTHLKGKSYELHCQKCGDIKLKTIYVK